MIDQLLAVIAKVFADPAVQFIAAHVGVNVVAAVAAALKTRQFSLARLGDFLVGKLAPHILVYGAARLIGDAAGVGWLAPAAFVSIEAALLADLADSLDQLGLPMPQALVKQKR